jgi:hypothetical protein
MKSSLPSKFLFGTVTAGVFVAAAWASSAVSAVGDATTCVQCTGNRERCTKSTVRPGRVAAADRDSGRREVRPGSQ